MKAEDFKWEDFPPRLSPRRDRLGRHNHDPRRLLHGVQGAVSLATWTPSIEIPAGFWSSDVEGKGGSVRDVAIVACPCGATPAVPLLGAPLECACERVYSFTGRDVLAFNSPREHTTGVPP